MRKTTLRALFLIATLIGLVNSAHAATQYCHTALSDGTYTVYLTCTQPSAGTYAYKIESPIPMTVSGGWFINANGAGGFQMSTSGTPTLSSDAKTLTYSFSSTTTPAGETPIYVILNGIGERNFAYPSDIDWTQTSCTYTAPIAPNTLPATPTVDPTRAIFLHNSSGNYTNAVTLDVTDANQWGGKLSESLYAVGGKNLISFTPTALTGDLGSYYHGGVLSAKLNVSPMKYLHVDVWVPLSTSWTDFAIAPISTGNPTKNGQPLQSIFTASKAGSWTSFDIQLSDLDATGLIDLTQIDQFIFKNSGNSAIAGIDANKVYLDNIYFWTDQSTSIALSKSALNVAAASSTNAVNITTTQSWTATSDQSWLTLSASSGTGNAVLTLTAAANTSYAIRTATVTVTANDGTVKTIVVTQDGAAPSAALTPAMNAGSVISVYSDAYTSIMSGWQDWYGNKFETVMIDGNTTLKNTSTCCFGTEFTSPLVDVKAMTKLHIDIFPIQQTAIKMGVVTDGAVEVKLPLTLTTGQWNSIDLSLSDLKTANPSIDLSKVKQIGFWDVNGSFYLDNIVFYNGAYSTLSGIKGDRNTAFNLNTLVKENLVIEAPKTIKEVTVYNTQGKLMKSTALNATNASVNVSNFVAGLYYVVVKYQDGTSSSAKVIKE